MSKYVKKLKDFSISCTSILFSEKGQTLVEYGLLIVLIALIVILMLKGTGLQINNSYSRINSTLAQ